MDLPNAPATERNREPILTHLRRIFDAPAAVLEIGSGTGQHAAYFAAALPHVRWQTSDRRENHDDIEAWCAAAARDNLLPPLTLDVTQAAWPDVEIDHVFTANTTHIMSWRGVDAMIAGVGARLPVHGRFVIYGPFNYAGAFTSDSNARFDASLRSQSGEMGIRDYEAMVEALRQVGMTPVEDNEMPANNRLLVFAKETGA